jgi:hypothetical protein
MNAQNHASNVIPISRAMRMRPKSHTSIPAHAPKPTITSHLRQNPRLLDYAILALSVLAALAIGRYLPGAIANNSPPLVNHGAW